MAKKNGSLDSFSQSFYEAQGKSGPRRSYAKNGGKSSSGRGDSFTSDSFTNAFYEAQRHQQEQRQENVSRFGDWQTRATDVIARSKASKGIYRSMEESQERMTQTRQLMKEAARLYRDLGTKDQAALFRSAYQLKNVRDQTAQEEERFSRYRNEDGSLNQKAWADMEAAKARKENLDADAATEKKWGDIYDSLTDREKDAVRFYGVHDPATLEAPTEELLEAYGQDGILMLQETVKRRNSRKWTEKATEAGQNLVDKYGALADLAGAAATVPNDVLTVLGTPARVLGNLLSGSEYKTSDPNSMLNILNAFKSGISSERNLQIQGRPTAKNLRDIENAEENGTATPKQPEEILSIVNENPLMAYLSMPEEDKKELEQWWADIQSGAVFEEDYPGSELEKKYTSWAVRGDEALEKMYLASHDHSPGLMEKGASFLHSAATAALDSMAGGLALKGFHALGMGASAAEQAASDYAKEGIGKGPRAEAAALANGAIETFTEGKTVSRLEDAMFGAGEDIWTAAAGEGFEEGLGDVLKLAAERLILQNDSGYSRNIQERMEQGEGWNQARRNARLDFAKDTLYDTAVGATSGAMGQAAGRALQIGNQQTRPIIDQARDQARGLYTGGHDNTYMTTNLPEGASVSTVTQTGDALADAYIQKAVADRGLLTKGDIQEILSDSATANAILQKAGMDAEGFASMTDGARMDTIRGAVNRISNWVYQLQGKQTQSRYLKAQEADADALTKMRDSGNATVNSIIEKAVNGKISNKDAAEIINDPVALSALRTVADVKGVESMSTMSAKRTAVKRAVSQLAGQVKAEQERRKAITDRDNQARQYAAQRTMTQETADELYSGSRLNLEGKAIWQDAHGVSHDSTVKGFAMDGGKLVMEMADGSRADAQKVSYGSAAETIVYRRVAEIAPNAGIANLLIDSYRTYAKGDVTNENAAKLYANAVASAYRYGYDQLTFRAFLNTELANGFSGEALLQAYRAGQMMSGAKVQAEQKNLEGKRQAQRTRTDRAKDGTVTLHGVNKKTLTERQQADVEAARVLARATGLQFHFVESHENADGKRVFLFNGEEHSFNGRFSARENTVWVDIHAGARGEGLATFTMAHETTHFIKAWSPAQFQKLQKFLFQNLYTDRGIDANDLILAKQQDLGCTRELAVEEVVADSMQKMFTDTDALYLIGKLRDQHRPIHEKILESINALTDKIRAAYKGERAIAADGALFNEGELTASLKELEGIKKLFVEGVSQASRNARMDSSTENGQKNNAANEGDGKLLIRYTADNQPAVIIDEDILNGVPKRRWEETVKSAISKFDGGIPVSGKLIKVNAKTKNEFFDSKYTKYLRAADGTIYADKMRSANNLDEIVLATTNYVNEDLRHERHDNFTEFARGDIRMRIGGNDYTAKTIIGFTSGRNMVLYDLIDFTPTTLDIKNEESPKAMPSGRKPMKQDSLDDLSIAQPAAGSQEGIRHEREDISAENGQKNNAAREGDVKYSPRMEIRESDESRYEKLKDSAVSIPSFRSISEKAGITITEEELDTLKHIRGDAAKPILKALGNRFAAFKKYVNQDAAIDMTFSVTSMNESVEKIERTEYRDGKLKKAPSDYRNFSKLLSIFDHVISGSVEIEEHENRYSKKGKNIKATHVLFGAFEADTLVPVKTEVREFNDGNTQNKLYVAVTLSPVPADVWAEYKKNSDHSAHHLPETDTAHAHYAVPAYSLPNIVQLVNSKDGEILKYFPNQMLDTEQLASKEAALEAERKYIDRKDQGEKFQVRKEASAQAARVLEERNARLEEDLKRARELLKLQGQITGGRRMTRSSVEAEARVLKKRFDCGGDTRTLADLLQTCYEQIAGAEELSMDRIRQYAEPVTDWLRENARDRLDPFAEDILGQIRGRKISLTDVQKQEAVSAYGSMRDFRRALAGSGVQIVSDGAKLDTIWAELTQMSPELFPEDTTEGDMATALSGAAERLRDLRADVSFGMGEAFWSQTAFEEVYDGYWNVSTLHTVADRYQKEILALKSRHGTQMEKARAANREAIARLRQAQKERVGKLRSDYSEQIARKTQALKDGYRQSREKAAEGRNKTALRHSIQRSVKRLNDLLLTDTAARHVPDSLKKAVAESLYIVNMDTADADARVEKLRQDMAEAAAKGNAERVVKLSESIQRIEAAGARMDEKLSALKTAYDSIMDDPNLDNFYDDGISALMQTCIDEVGDTPLRNMTLGQLEAVKDLYTAVRHTVSEANRVFLEGKKAATEEAAGTVMEEVNAQKKRYGAHTAAGDMASQMGWANLKPVYAFKRMGSKTMMSLYQNVRKGQDTWYRDVSEANAYLREQTRKFGQKNWDMEQTYSFTASSGESFRLSLNQIMSLYAYAKREAARDHIRKGGIVLRGDAKAAVRKLGKLEIRGSEMDSSAYKITDETLGEIIGTLTEEQRGYADAMQSYLSDTMGGKGNEVSLELYGIRLFKESSYFPLRSAPEYMARARESQQKEQAAPKLKNKGFTKSTVKHARNPIVVENFLDVWSDHVNEMSMYHAFTLPLEAIGKVYNWHDYGEEGQAARSVNATLKKAFGSGATDYLENLLNDLNGGARADPNAGLINKTTGLFKKGATFLSLSVVIQQPSAIMRATAMIDPKYFIGGKVTAGKHGEIWNELKEHAAVAGIKEMGYFDVGLGRSTRDFIQQTDLTTWEEKARALIHDSSYRDEILGRAPALADEVAWCGIWNAVKREQKALHPGMDVSSRQFLDLCGERFSEVIDYTQVYDSVLTRSQMMRSRDTGVKMATSFMAEPTVNANMLMSALDDFRKGDRARAAKQAGGVVTAAILNSILVAFVYAARDKDDDKEYWEKYLAQFVGSVKDGLNPLNMLPFGRDITNLFQGYQVERSDMAIASDFIEAWQKLFDGSADPLTKVEKFAGALGNLFGLPIRNIIRDAHGIYNAVQDAFDGNRSTASGAWNAVKGELPFMKADDHGTAMYKALLSGDQEYYKRMRQTYKDDAAADTALRKALRENDPRVHEAAKARNSGNTERYTRLAKEIIGEGHFRQDEVIKAINAEISQMNKGGEEESQAKGSPAAMYKPDELAAAMIAGNRSMTEAITEDLVRVKMADGMTEQRARESVNASAKSALKDAYLDGDLSDGQAETILKDRFSTEPEEAKKTLLQWQFQAEYSYAWADRKDAYFDGVVSESAMIGWMEKSGKSREDAEATVELYNWEREWPELEATEAQVRAYRETGAGDWMEPGDFVEAWRTMQGLKSDYKENGKAVSGSKMKKVFAYVDTLPLTPEQKTALAIGYGDYSINSVYKYAPWAVSLSK